jgi:hypothetical protein
LTIQPLARASLPPENEDPHNLHLAIREMQDSLQRQMTEIKECLRPAKPNPNFQTAVDLLIRWLAARSISFRAIESPIFVDFCKALNPYFSIPNHKNLKRLISRMANIQFRLPPRSIRTFCSLMIDGATKFNHRLLAVIMFLQGRVHFLDLFELSDQKSETIALKISPLIEKLSEDNLIVTAVCTDNARNEKAVLDPRHDYSLQQMTGLPILRIPCMAHTMNLAMQDFLNGPSPSILVRLQQIIKALPRGSNFPFYSMPRIVQTRWLTCGEVVTYLLRKQQMIELYLSEKGPDSAASCLRTLGIPHLHRFFRSSRQRLFCWKGIQRLTLRFFQLLALRSSFSSG